MGVPAFWPPSRIIRVAVSPSITGMFTSMMIRSNGWSLAISTATWPFSAVEPSLAIPGFLSRKRALLEQELTDQGRSGTALVDDLKEIYSEGQGGRGTLDYLRIVTEPAQTGAEPASIALAWLSSRKQVAAPIASARKLSQLPTLLAASSLKLTQEQLDALTVASA